MNHTRYVVAAAIGLLAGFDVSMAQVVGGTTVDVAVTQSLVLGLSAKRQVIGQRVYNEAGEAVGRIDDLIIAPDDAISFAIVGAGGFVGLRRHQVAIPINLLTGRAGSEAGFLLTGATKDVIKAIPAFEYNKPLDRSITRNPSFHR